MNALADAILAFFAGAPESILPFFGAISLIGGAAMGIVQSVKDNTPLRRKFNEQEVDRWLTAHITGDPTQGQRLLEQLATGLRHMAGDAKIARVYSAARAEEAANALDDASRQLATPGSAKAVVLEQIVRLAVDGERSALYELEADKMVAQIKAAYASAIDAPHKHAALVALASCFSEDVDIDEVLGGPPIDPGDKVARARYSDARTRVFQQFQRASDALLVKLSFRWKSRLQQVAWAMCGLLTFIVLFGAFTTWSGWSHLGATLLEALVTATLAAFFAPIARDVVAAVGQLRKL